MKHLLAILLSSLAITAHGADVVLGLRSALTYTGTGTVRVATFGLPDVTDGLVAWWTFDEGSGTQAICSVSSIPAVFKGSPSALWTNGVSGSSVSFNGATAYLDAGDVFDLGTNSITISAWIYTTNVLGHNKAIIGIVGKTRYAAQDGRWMLDFFRTGTVWSNSAAIAPLGDIAVNWDDRSNQWTHVCASLQRNGQAILYHNGIQMVSASFTAGANYDTSNHLLIGAFNDGTGNGAQSSTFFPGRIDEVRIYNRALSSNEVYQIWNKYKP